MEAGRAARTASVLQNVAIDCADGYGLAPFWSEVTGRPLDPDGAPGDRETRVLLAEGSVLYFNRVPEPRRDKNRPHLCLRPDTSRDQEVERLPALGAALLSGHRHPTAPAGRSSPIRRATSSASSAAHRTAPPRTPESRQDPLKTADLTEFPNLRPVLRRPTTLAGASHGHG